MRRVSFFLMLALFSPACGAFAAGTAASKGKAQKASPKIITLDIFIQKALASGKLGRVPAPIAGLIGVSDDAMTLDVDVSSDQATDKMFHSMRVMLDTASETAKGTGLVLRTNYKWSGNDEHCYFHASLDGKLEKVIYGHGKLDEQGNAIKGSGTAIEKDINSPEIKERFQHELDLWLKKSYLKKEWKSAEFVEGALKRKS